MIYLRNHENKIVPDFSYPLLVNCISDTCIKENTCHDYTLPCGQECAI